MVQKRYQLLATFTFATMVLLGTIFFSQLSNRATTPHLVTAKQKKISIAIVSIKLSAHPQAVADRYCADLNSIPDVEWCITKFDAKGDKVLLHAMINEILMSNYDLVYTIGTMAGTVMQQYIYKRNSKKPMIFSAILEYVWNDWCTHTPNLKDRATGSYGSYDWPRRVNLLRLLLPETHHVLIPLPSSGEYANSNITDLQDELSRQNIKSLVVDIEDKSDSIQKLRPFLPYTDVVILPRETLGMGFTDLLIDLTQRYGKPTYSADSNSVRAGGTIGLGFDETMPGSIAAKQTYQILIEQKQPADIPIVNFNDTGSHFVINRTQIEQLSPKVDQQLLWLVQKGFVIRSKNSGFFI